MVYTVHSRYIVGVDDVEGPPVPMPNTEVKLNGAENTWLVTTWEDRKMPILVTSFFIEKSTVITFVSMRYLCSCRFVIYLVF